jgi:exopolysaccharide biosynthesis polyprenyl glycosylphosphotransferase
MGRIPHLLVYTPVVALADLALIHASFVGVLFIKHGYTGIPTPYLASYTGIIPSISLLSLVILHFFNLYAGWLRSPPKQLIYFTCVSALLVCTTSTLLLEWEQQCRLSFPVLGRSAVLMCGLLIVYRLLLRQFYWSQVGHCRVMVMAADEAEGAQIIRKLEPVAPGWMEFVGYAVERDFHGLRDTAYSFDALLLAPGLAQERTLMTSCAQMHKKVMAFPALMEMSLLCGRVLEMQDLLVVEMQSPHLTREQNLMKRIFDLVLGTALLVLSSPVLLATAAMIRFTSEGPVIFKQERVGRDGVEYQLYKFRTMVTDAEKHTGPVLARECDPRITALGHVLRATRIDELPQLVNVLIGNMSMIGPRPERQFFVNTFRETLPDYDLRFAVKPGITGLAQVAGSYSTPVEQKLKFDLLYISDYSLMRDIRIVLRTIPVVFHGERAQGIKGLSPSSTVAEDHISASSSSHSSRVIQVSEPVAK